MNRDIDTLCILAETLSDFEKADLNIDAVLAWAYVDDRAQRLQRIDLANSLPILVPMLVFYPNDPWSQSLAEQLCRGSSPLECLTETFPTKSLESARTLIGKPLALIGNWSLDVVDLMLAIECLDVEELPETEAEWRIFSEFARALHPFESMLSGYVFRNLCRQGYLSSYNAAKDTTDGNPSRLSLINDYSRYLGRRFGGMLQCQSSNKSFTSSKDTFALGVSEDFLRAGEKLAESRLKQFSVLELLSQALRWDTAFRRATIEGYARLDDPVLARWPALFENPVVSGGYQVVSLTSAADVASEYRKLHLEPESVLSEGALGKSYVVALKDLDGGTRTVASIWIHGPDAGIYLAYDSMHRGENGRFAFLAEEDALIGALKLFWEVEHQERLVRLVNYHRARRVAVEQKLEGLTYGYDITESMLSSVVPQSLMSI